MLAKVKITFTTGSLKDKKFEFSLRTTCIIGRAKDCNLRLPNDAHHKTVSRYHCLMDINPPAICVRDLGSLHGTYVNGKIIGKRQSNQTPKQGIQSNFPEYDLKDGDEIRLGNTVFRVNIQADKEILRSPVVKLPSDPNLPMIQDYTTRKLLGKGGYGEVYLACHNQTGERVALKVMRPHIATNQRAINMFLREVENTKALQHPNVVQFREFGYDNRNFFFTLEYCDGGSVGDLILQRGGRLPIDDAVSIILQVLEGLEYAHNAEISTKISGSLGKGKGLVHRDLKPGNIFLANVGSTPIAKLADYGLAKAFDLAGLSGQTRSGSRAGTPAFMPRQQVINFKYAKPEVDVWASAASLYYMLTGTCPRDFQRGQDPWLVVLQTNAVPIRQRDSLIPERLAEVIDQALVDNPSIHFRSVAEFRETLEGIL
jgi:eukaryotic-like serine/threonine-protein kinase